MARRRSTGHDTLLLLAVALAAAASFSPAAASKKEVKDICKSTPFPKVCTKTAGKQAARYPHVDPLTVLQMQVDAFAMRTGAARKRIEKELGKKKVSPAAKTTLKLCNRLYTDVHDNLGAARRAIGFKDAVTIRAVMGMAAQDMEGCDEEFKKAGEKNSLNRFNKSLLQISENCRALSNMIG